VFLGVIHRLDRPTSGLVVFARTSKALSRMNALFAEGKTRKSYRAIVGCAPDPPNGELIHYLQRNPKQNKSYAFRDPGKGRKRAVLSYKTIQVLDRYYLLDIDLQTGRHHQIRAQLAAMGCPIKGDLKYGAPRSNPDGSIHLHARQLEFIHPVRKTRVSLTAPYPGEALWGACE
jgi:23S rRNA pseudouridine1911/1915/1917 synthase